MSAHIRHPLPDRLHTLAAMAGLLERLEREPGGVSPDQYRGVVRQVQALLADAEADEHLERLLNAAPHTAALYENLRYGVAGLCRSPLDAALEAELAAAAALRRASQHR